MSANVLTIDLHLWAVICRIGNDNESLAIDCAIESTRERLTQTLDNWLSILFLRRLIKFLCNTFHTFCTEKTVSTMNVSQSLCCVWSQFNRLYYINMQKVFQREAGIESESPCLRKIELHYHNCLNEFRFTLAFSLV